MVGEFGEDEVGGGVGDLGEDVGVGVGGVDVAGVSEHVLHGFMSVWAARARLPAPWRRSCSRTGGGRPVAVSRVWKRWISQSGWIGRPSARVNTQAPPRHRVPMVWRSVFCRWWCRRSRATVASSRATARSPDGVLTGPMCMRPGAQVICRLMDAEVPAAVFRIGQPRASRSEAFAVPAGASASAVDSHIGCHGSHPRAEPVGVRPQNPTDLAKRVYRVKTRFRWAAVQWAGQPARRVADLTSRACETMLSASAGPARTFQGCSPTHFPVVVQPGRREGTDPE